MNLSNDILFKAVNAFVDAISDGIAQKLEERLAALETKVQNTLDNTPAILENMQDRQQRLEDKFDQLTTASDERIEEIAKGVMGERLTDSDVEQMIDTALENYEPEEHIEMESSVRNALDGAYWFEDAVKETVRSLTFNVEVN